MARHRVIPTRDFTPGNDAAIANGRTPPDHWRRVATPSKPTYFIFRMAKHQNSAIRMPTTSGSQGCYFGVTDDRKSRAEITWPSSAYVNTHGDSEGTAALPDSPKALSFVQAKSRVAHMDIQTEPPLCGGAARHQFVQQRPTNTPAA